MPTNSSTARIAPPEPYKGKGVFVDGEHVVRKERKKAAAVA